MGSKHSVLLPEDVGSLHSAEDVEFNTEKKILVLGTGETGKTAFCRQILRITAPEQIFAKETELGDTLETVKVNIITAIKQLAEYIHKNNIPFTTDTDVLDFFLRLERDYSRNINSYWCSHYPDLIPDLKTMWSNPTIQELFLDKHKLCNNFPAESIEYFMNKIDEINSAGYTPTVQDWLYSKVQTTAFTQENIHTHDMKLWLINLGGALSARKTWAYNFDNVSCIVYMTSLPEYATLSWDDKKTNRARQSIDCFNETVNSPELAKVPFLLVLNKADMLPHVIKRCKFSSEFTEYEGSDDSCTEIITFMKDMYMKQYTGTESSKILPIVLNTMDVAKMKDALDVLVDVASSGRTSGHTFKMYDPSSN